MRSVSPYRINSVPIISGAMKKLTVLWLIVLLMGIVALGYGGMCSKDDDKSGSSGAILRVVNNAGYDVRVSVKKDLYDSSQVLGDVAAYSTKDFSVASGNYDTVIVFRPYSDDYKTKYNFWISGTTTFTYP